MYQHVRYKLQQIHPKKENTIYYSNTNSAIQNTKFHPIYLLEPRSNAIYLHVEWTKN